MTGRAEDAVLASLDRLVRRELLIRDDDPRSPERGQYRFVQAVVREVAYETLARADRRGKHLAAARYFEALGDDELSGVLANHYLEALRATPAGPEADALAAQARIALRAAADRAIALHAWTVAQRHLADALEISSDPAELAALHLAIAQNELYLMRPESVDHALQAAELAVQLGDRGTENRARALAGQVFVNRSMGAEALAILEPAVQDLGEDEPHAAELFAELGRLCMMTDRSKEAVERAEQALRAAAPTRNTEVIANALVTQGSAVGDLGRYDEAEALLRGAMILADREGHVAAALRARNNLVSLLIAEAPLSVQAPLLDESIDLAMRYGIAGWGAQHLTSRTWLNIEWGEWHRVSADLATLEEFDLGEMHNAVRLSSEAFLAAVAGGGSKAEEFLAEVRRLLTTFDTVPQVTGITSYISSVYLVLGEWSKALEVVEGLAGGGNDAYLCQYSAFAAAAAGDRDRVVSILERTQTFGHLRFANAVRIQVQASEAASRASWDEARARYMAAQAAFRVLECHFVTALLGIEFGAYLGDRFDDARAAGEAAAAWFAERGADSVVDRYRANFRGTPAPPASGAGTKKQAVPVDAEQPA
jgi:tetratricopeptide (TPR) repeat protein